MLFFTYYHPHGKVLWLPYGWNLVFILVNVFQIFSLLSEKYAATLLSSADSDVRDNFFREFDVTDWSKLVRIGKRTTLNKSETLFKQAEENEYVGLVVSGELECLVDGERTYVLKPGNFVAEAGLHAGASVKGAVKTSGTVRAIQPTTIIKWNRSELSSLLDVEDSLRKSLQSRLSWDIVSKLKLQRQALENGGIKAEKARKWTQKRNVQTEQRFEALLAAFLVDGKIEEKDKEVIEKYRSIHVIDDEVLFRTLAKLGWGEPEWEKGCLEAEGKVRRRKELERRNSDCSL
eukprot:CAMPEP_0182499032 /NCGR_PEP_ID=MMETSP1321-20130603/7033_1 /TAXON_ID=91990 /ORGANISM="Bolidomonas sp., Strain RCC1657" /LENGTH=289 /DNA_ID=CAMNT_0024703155 /DNA_START=624 /DNA_END=1493 /DNA_ORIENTATION=+